MSAQAMSMHSTANSLDYGVGLGLALLIAGMIGFGLARAGAAPLQMEVYGDLAYVDSDAVQELVVPLLGDGFFQLDADDLERRLQALPWVQSVQVERLWPDRVALHLRSHYPLAAWGEDAVLTRSGDLIYPTSRPELGLVVESPEDKAADVFADLQLVLSRLPQGWSLLQWTVSSTGDRQAQIQQAEQPLTLEFGRSPVGEKFKLWAEVVLPVLQPRLNEVAVVDLRYRNGFAVRWLADSEAQEQK